MLSPFPSSHLSFLPLQAVLYFSVSSSACPNSQWCFPTFSFSRNTRHSVNFPFDFFIAFPLKSDSQLFLPGPPSWGLLENLLSWAGEKRRRLPRCPVFPVFPLPSSRLTPSSPPVPTQVHFHWDRPPHLLPWQDQLLPSRACDSPALCIFHLGWFLFFSSLLHLQPEIRLLHFLPASAWQCLTKPHSLLQPVAGSGVTSSMAFCLLSFWSHGAAFFLCCYVSHAFCMAVAFLITKVTDHPLSAEGPEMPYSPHIEPWPDCRFYPDAFLIYRALLALFCKSFICNKR